MPNIINDVKLDFKDVLLRPKRSTLKSRSDVDLCREITFRNSKRTYRGVPVMASNMDTVGTFEMAKALSKHGLFVTMHKYYTCDEWKEFAIQNPECLKNMAASSGTGNEDFERLSSVLAAVPELTFICIDVANGYSQHFVEYVRKVRSKYPDHTIIAGNVVTGEMVEELILSGADIIKVGIGPGSVCTTRMKTGVGYPQLSAVIECADAAHGLKGHIISVRRRLHVSRRHCQSFRRWRRFRHGRRHVRWPRRVLGRSHREKRPKVQALLRHGLAHGHAEARRRSRRLQVVRGKNRGGTVPRAGGSDAARHHGWTALGLHLRRGLAPPGAPETRDLHPMHPTAQQHLRTAHVDDCIASGIFLVIYRVQYVECRLWPFYT
uniref:GMP reductase n=1 Tax=Trichogramma kaykai TaxID=54128 RepID=A0ABD2WX95_9HYME